MTIRLPRRMVALIAAMALPLSVAACGLIAGDKESQVPVVIPSDDTGDGSAPSGDLDSAGQSPTDSGSSTSVSIPLPPSTASKAAPAPAPVRTVTKTGIVVHRQTLTRTVTRTLPRATVMKTLRPITVTETRTETKTETKEVTVPGPTTTIRCSLPAPAC